MTLDNVTLVCIDTVNPKLAVRALRYSARGLFFNSIKLVSNVKPDNLHGITFVQTESLSHGGYSHYCLRGLNSIVNTDFCLLVQTDGFVINPQLWKPEFLHYDYIGAPWPPDAPWVNGNEKLRVGNGGFSLRSKKLLQLCSSNRFDASGGHEDVVLVAGNRALMESNGIRFAPVPLAMQFSLEINLPERGCFNPFGWYTPADLKHSVGFHNRNIYPQQLKLLEDVALDLPSR